jgi:endonuclease YncB( thermonuclease family)
VRRLARGRRKLPRPTELTKDRLTWRHRIAPFRILRRIGLASVMVGNSRFRQQLTSITLAAAILVCPAASCRAQVEERPHLRNVTPPNAIRTHRLRVPADFFEQDAVHFQTAHVDMSGSIRADGHNLELYGAVSIRRNRICTSTEGARWACGQHALMALRNVVDGKSITCSFKHNTVPPKAVCQVGDSDVTRILLSQGWAELADEVTDEAYLEALAFAQSTKAGIWADGPP